MTEENIQLTKDELVQASSTKDEQVQASSTSDEKTCHFCSTPNSKYNCPKCGIKYCSTICYKHVDHLSCSEKFFKQCIEEHIKSNPIDNQQSKKMMEMLQRIHQGSMVEEDDTVDSDDEDDNDLASRLESIDLNDADAVWQMLTDAEKAGFESLISSGDVANILPMWNPWWIQKKVLIEDLSEPQEDNVVYPDLIDNIAAFSTISKVQPSPIVIYNLTNILGSYTFTMRYFNGDSNQFSLEAATCLIKLSDKLSNKKIEFTDSDLALEAVSLNAINILKASPEDTSLIKSDVQSITSENKKLILYALSDIHHLLSNAKSNLQTNKKQSNKVKESFSKRFPESNGLTFDITINKTDISTALRIVKYFLSWTDSFYTTENQMG